MNKFVRHFISSTSQSVHERTSIIGRAARENFDAFAMFGVNVGLGLCMLTFLFNSVFVLVYLHHNPPHCVWGSMLMLSTLPHIRNFVYSVFNGSFNCLSILYSLTDLGRPKTICLFSAENSLDIPDADARQGDFTCVHPYIYTPGKLVKYNNRISEE